MSTTDTEKSQRLIYAVPSRTRSVKSPPKEEISLFIAQSRSQEEWEPSFFYKARVALICQWNIPEMSEGAILYSVRDWK